MKLRMFVVLLIAAGLILSCSSKEKKWGKEFDLEGKWWEQNGQSFDPNTKVFMAVGMSRGTYGSLRLERDSADMDSRKQASNFMQTMVASYVKECTENNVDVSENMVQAVSKEILVGSAIVERHYDQAQKIYYSLVKVDLKYFFDKIKDEVVDTRNKTLMEKYKGLDPTQKDEKVNSEIEELKGKIAKVEEAVNEEAKKTVVPTKSNEDAEE